MRDLALADVAFAGPPQHGAGGAVRVVGDAVLAHVQRGVLAEPSLNARRAHAELVGSAARQLLALSFIRRMFEFWPKQTDWTTAGRKHVYCEVCARLVCECRISRRSIETDFLGAAGEIQIQ